jgi:hypothetical protein
LPLFASTTAALAGSAADAALCAGLAAATVARGVGERSSMGARFGVCEQPATTLMAISRAPRRRAQASIRDMGSFRSWCRFAGTHPD